ncbi:lipolytic protein, partial [Burkholderia stagnalis]
MHHSRLALNALSPRLAAAAALGAVLTFSATHAMAAAPAPLPTPTGDMSLSPAGPDVAPASPPGGAAASPRAARRGAG